MKRMLMLLLAAMLCFTVVSFAQSTDMSSQSAGQQSSAMQPGDDHARAKMDPQQVISQLDQQLSLTAEQKAKITTILENSNKHGDELRANSSGDASANKEAMRQLHENTHAQIRATLTPEQQTKFDAMMKEKHDKSASPNSTTESPK